MQWHTPIGYCVRDGKIVIDENKSDIVKRIFTDYDNGISAVQIAKSLLAEGIENKRNRVSWTHGTVGRILENYNYLGTEYYPQLIETEMFYRVQKMREQRNQNLRHGTFRSGKTERILFGGVIKCGACGATYVHYTGNNGTKILKPKWKCKNYVKQNRLCCAGGFIRDEEVKDLCIKVINQILEDKELIKNVPGEQDVVTQRCSVLDQMLKQMQDEGYEKTSILLFDRASERYLTLKVRDTDEQTKLMLEVMEDTDELVDFDENLYKKLIKEIIVNKDSTATVIFKNGSRITTDYMQKDHTAFYFRKGVVDGN